MLAARFALFCRQRSILSFFKVKMLKLRAKLRVCWLPLDLPVKEFIDLLLDEVIRILIR
jgi:hypothetical protein